MFVGTNSARRIDPCTAEAPETMPMLKTAHFISQNGRAWPGQARAGKAPAEGRPSRASPHPPTCPGIKYPVRGNPSLRFHPCTPWMGLDRIGASFRRRLPGPFLANLAHVWQSTLFSRLAARKEISARHYREIARNYVARLFLRSANSKKVSVSGDNLTPYF